MENNNNIQIYEKYRQVPENAKKTIAGGRLKNMTDINPMWRIKALTEQFGVCGIGWRYEITKQWTEQTTPEEIAAFTNINLFIKHNGEWSEAIPGNGGSSFLTKEKGGLYTNDECYKMALTDALSVACKALGIGADVYWEKDNTKYNDTKKNQQKNNPVSTKIICSGCPKEILDIKKKDGTTIPAQEIQKIGIDTYGRALCVECMKTAKELAEKKGGENA